MSAASRKYLEMSIRTAPPEELILRVYDVLVMAGKAALQQMYDNRADVQAVYDHVRRAQSALVVLMGGLDLEAGGELAKNLLAIYEFWHWQLSLAGTRRDPSYVERVLPHFIEYRKTWAEVVRRYRAEQVAGKKSEEVNQQYA